jgi:4-hydroxy-3-polyprenylbenzoate decarboxylase
VNDLERTGHLRRIDAEIDPYLEMAEIQRRVYAAQGPALLFTRVKGCRFPMLGNLFGTMERARYIFRHTLESVRHLVELKVDPSTFWKRPWRYRDVPRTMWNLRPKFVSSGPVLAGQCKIQDLPQQISWPKDGGAFITLPQVYSEDTDRPGWRHSNLGMYRIQLSGGEYELNREVGMHYQIHRGIGMHHAAAIRKGVPFRVTIAVGGPPAMTLAAIMPLPEGLPELAFGGALGGRRVRLVSQPRQSPIFADADFCITGTIDLDKLKPEGPFGDHLGYYSLAHPFPVLNVEQVYHRADAIWPFTVVGRPPQEDTVFGTLIHEMTGPVIPTVVHGVKAIHAVDASGVHPLLLAVGSERYVPFAKQRKPQELLTIANAILGQGQLSLAKYLFIVAHEDNPDLDIHDVPAFLRHLLERVDWRTDLHFQTCTTIDTLDYSGSGLNEGSKLVIAAAGPKRRELPQDLQGHVNLPEGFCDPCVCLPGIVAIRGPKYMKDSADVERYAASGVAEHGLREFPLHLIVDDSEFTSRSLNNMLWVTFTRSNPAPDIHGVDAFTIDKHWGCRGPLIIDARIKTHHAPPLEEDPAVSKRVDELGAKGGPLAGLL